MNQELENLKKTIDWLSAEYQDAPETAIKSLKIQATGNIHLMTDYWFNTMLGELDYEIVSGTWDNPLWAWRTHPWFEILKLTEEQCCDWFDQDTLD